MALDNFVRPKIAIAVAVTAAIASPSVRRTVRKGAVHGLAGLLSAGDRLSALAEDASRRGKQAGEPARAAARPSHARAVKAATT